MDRKLYEVIAQRPDELPDGVKKQLAPVVLERFGGPLEQVLREVAEHMPTTLASLKAHYGPPLICARQVVFHWVPMFALEGKGRNVFGAFHLDTFYTLYDFDELVGYLPRAMQSLYYFTDGLMMTSKDYADIDWNDLPVGYSGRRDVHEYCEINKYSPSAPAPMINALKSPGAALEVWMFGSHGDALFVNKEKKDRRLYHVRRDDFADFAAIPDPDAFIDRYCAHVFAGHDPAAFDFRARYR